MRIKLTLTRPSGSSADIVVTTDAAASIAEVASTIARVDPQGPDSANADFTLHAGAFTFNGIALGTIAAIVIYHVMKAISRVRGTG